MSFFKIHHVLKVKLIIIALNNYKVVQVLDLATRRRVVCFRRGPITLR